MKRKKLTFMNVKEADLLSRHEMRNVMAGSGANFPGYKCCNSAGDCTACTNTQYGCAYDQQYCPPDYPNCKQVINC